jgi:hypothetical protein
MTIVTLVSGCGYAYPGAGTDQRDEMGCVDGPVAFQRFRPRAAKGLVMPDGSVSTAC